MFGLLVIACAAGQEPNPTQQGLSRSEDRKVPLYKVEVVARTIAAVNYHHRSGVVPIDFRGTELMPQAKGKANVDSRNGATKIDVEVEKLSPAAQYGQEFLTYVLWAVTPQGRAENVGELVLHGDKAHLPASTELQVFGLFVTAEPYYAVTQPSDVVVMENRVRDDTRGTIEQVDARFELLRRGSYTLSLDRSRPWAPDEKQALPLELREAYHALDIAQQTGAAQYAAETLEKARNELNNAIGFYNNGGDSKQVITLARESTQHSEDARLITLRRQRAEESVRVSAEVQSAKELAEKAQADRERALQEMQDAKAQVERELASRALAGESGSEKMDLQSQLGSVLPTRQTQNGLAVSVPEYLFDTARSTLNPAGREKLAKIAGLLLGYPGVRMQIVPYPDGDRRAQDSAQSVRAYFVSQGITPDMSVSGGSGTEASRHVDIVVSGGPLAGQTRGEVSRLSR